MVKKKSKTTITETLRRAILESDVSFNELARQTGLDVGNLHRFANGHRGLSLDSLDILAEHLGFVLVRPGGTGKLRRGAARLVLAATIATAQFDSTPINETIAALVSVGHQPAEAQALVQKASASGQQFGSAADLLAAIYRPGKV
jgi:hypothetical protein